MGHQKTATLPDTAPWRRIVKLLAEDEPADIVASATTEAAVQGLFLAKTDAGLIESVLAMAEIATAARSKDFENSLSQAGFFVSANASAYDLLAAYSETLDRRLAKSANRTDLSEMAQQAGLETLSTVLLRKSNGLFGEAPSIHQAVKELSTRNGFASLSHEFFSRFCHRFLTYHLSRELPQHVGGLGRFAHPNDHSDFVDQLSTHCREATSIMRKFAGEFYDKHRYLGGVTRSKVRGFVYRAIEKVQKELVIRGDRHG